MRAVGEPAADTELDPVGATHADPAGSGAAPVESETERLRRHLRALAAVNRQLFAQLEGTGPVRQAPNAPDGDLLAEETVRLPSVAIRRLGPATEMADRLAAGTGGATPYLTRSATSGGWVVEGRGRRPVKSRFIYDALVGVLEERALSDAELERLEESVPVEVLEGPTGPAFVVVGGRAYPLRGLPLPYPVTHDQMARFPKGPELRVRAGSGGSGGSSVRAVAGRLRRAVRRG